jgi:hypothetical protein
MYSGRRGSTSGTNRLSPFKYFNNIFIPGSIKVLSPGLDCFGNPLDDSEGCVIPEGKVWFTHDFFQCVSDHRLDESFPCFTDFDALVSMYLKM